METALRVLVGLDGASFALALLLVLFFARTWRRSGDMLHLLFAVGFALLGTSFLTASTSQFELVEEADLWGISRMAGQLGGALVLAFAYVSANRHGEPRPWTVAAWTVAALAGVAVLLFVLVPPTVAVPAGREIAEVSHGIMVVAYAACVYYSVGGWRREPHRPARLLVPLAFLALAINKYTWLLIDISGAEILVPIVYAWRIVGLGLLLAAVALPARFGQAEGPDATA